MPDQATISQVVVQVEYEISPAEKASQLLGQGEYHFNPDRITVPTVGAQAEIQTNPMRVEVSAVVVQAEYFSDTDLPAAPTGLAVVSGWSKNTVSWNSVAGATSYNIYWS